MGLGAFATAAGLARGADRQRRRIVELGPTPPYGVRSLWVPESRRMSCDLLILVDEPAEAVVSFDLVDLGCCATGEWS